MLATSRSVALIGVDAVPVEVEVDVSPGIPSFTLVGLPDQAVSEAPESGYGPPSATAGIRFRRRASRSIRPQPTSARKARSTMSRPTFFYTHNAFRNSHLSFPLDMRDNESDI